MSGPENKFKAQPPSAVIESILDPRDVMAGELAPHERELLEKPVLGKRGHAENLFNRFTGRIKVSSDPQGINTLRMVIMPAGMSPDEIELTFTELQLKLDTPVIFNDQFSGHILELDHTIDHGVYSMTLTDRHEYPRELEAEPFAWEDPTIKKMQEELVVGSSVSIHRTGDRARGVFIQGIVNGRLVRSEVTERAELGFAEICDQLQWSPAI